MAYCNARPKRCKGQGCDYRYTAADTEGGVTACPRCNRPRGHCQAQAVTGSDKCRHHGGKSLKGIAHPNFRGAGTAKNMPRGLLESYEAVQNDPDYLNLRVQMGVVESLMNDTLKMVQGGASGDKWKAVKRLVKKYRNAPDREGEEEAFDELEEVVNDGVVDFNARIAVMKAADTYRKLHDSTVKKMQATGGTFTGEQVIHLLLTMVMGVRRIVTDKQQRNAIADLYDSLVAQAGRPAHALGDGRGYTGDDDDADDRAIPAEVVSGDPGLQRQEA